MFNSNLSTALLATEMTGFFYIYYSANTELERIPKKSQHRKLTLEKPELNFPADSVWVDSNPGPFDHESYALTTELSPLPGGSSRT